MKKTVKILAIILAALFVLGLCACGSNDEKESGESTKNSGTSDLKKAVELCESDEKFLQQQGYTTYVYSSYLDSYAAELGVDVKDLVRIINAYDNDGNHMLVYYFKTESQAKSVYQKDTSSYKLVGTRVVYGDPENLIK